jgi:hypothetical protein
MTNTAIQSKPTSNTDLRSVIGIQTELSAELTNLVAALDPADKVALAKANELLSAALKGLRSDISSGATAQHTAVNGDTVSPVKDRQQAIIAKYGIQVLGDSQVRFKVPVGSSRVDLFAEIQEVVKEKFGQNAVNPRQLALWGNDPEFNVKMRGERFETVDGNVKGTLGLSRSAQTDLLYQQVRVMSPLYDLAVAHACYFLATGKDMFDGHGIRAHRGELNFSKEGLSVPTFLPGLVGDPDAAFTNTGAAAWGIVIRSEKDRYPSAAARAHANAMAEAVPSGDPDEAARQGKY